MNNGKSQNGRAHSALKSFTGHDIPSSSCN